MPHAAYRFSWFLSIFLMCKGQQADSGFSKVNFTCLPGLRSSQIILIHLLLIKFNLLNSKSLWIVMLNAHARLKNVKPHCPAECATLLPSTMFSDYNWMTCKINQVVKWSFAMIPYDSKVHSLPR